MPRQVWSPTSKTWLGIGDIPASGHRLRPAYAHLDAELRFSVSSLGVPESSECMAGEVLRGLKRPTECPAFGSRCTPDAPLGATMVSSEGACAAYFQHGRRREGSLPVVTATGVDA